MILRLWRAVVSMGCAVVLVAMWSHGASAAPRSVGGRAASLALAQRGVPYAWGGASPQTGFDASGLVQWVYGRVDHFQLPHSAPFLKKLGQSVGQKSLRPGDLVFFDHNLDVGIYVGFGRFVHAPGGNRTTVRTDSLGAQRYVLSYSGAKRLTLH